MAIRNLSGEEELSASASMFPRAGEGRNVEEVLEDFAKIAAEKGIQLYSVRVKCGCFKWKFKPPDAGAAAGSINVLAVNTGGQTRLVVKFFEPMDSIVDRWFEYDACLAAQLIELLAMGLPRPDRVVTRNADRAPVIDGLVGDSDLIRQVKQGIEGDAPAPVHGDSFPALREGETLIEYIGRTVLAVYERERAQLGSHSATARRLGMKRTTLSDWLERARRYITK
jgi:hypothetical protein